MAALTERALVALLAQRFASLAPGVELGIGDDAAVLAPSPEPWVCSVDASVEGVHFDLAYLTYEDVGYRSFQAAASDLGAMGATPAAALSALILPRALAPEAIDRLTAGQAQASRETGCSIVGGNISRGTELSVTTTVLGHAREPLRRSGALPGDELWLVGPIGLAAAGLAYLRLARAPAGPGTALQHLAEGASTAAPGSALARCVEAWRRPRALLEEGRQLVGRAHAAIDISDGLSSDAAQLASASRVRVVVDREQLRASLDPGLFAAQRCLRRSALHFALSGGEDYALLAAGPRRLRPSSAVPIGYIARGSGAFLANGPRLLPLGKGFDHLRS
jgi:thiamine-monophosphate kinase